MTEAGILAHLKDRKKEQIFRANESSLSNLNATISGGLVATSSIVTKLEVISGVISGELNDLSAIWNVFDFNKIDMHNYLVAKYDDLSEDMKITVQRDYKFIKKNFSSIINAIEDCMENGPKNTIELLNNLLINDGTGWSAYEEDVALDSLFMLTSTILLWMNINAFTVAPEDRADYYARFKNLEQLNVILAQLKSATTDDGSEFTDGINNDITSISFDEQSGNLTIKRAFGSSTLEVDTSILDTDGSKLISDDIKAWEESIQNKNKEMFVLLLALGSMGLSGLGVITIESISVAEQQIQNSIDILHDISKNSKAIGKIEVANGKTVDDILGTTTDGDGNAIINFIPVMVINTFISNGGDFYNIYPPNDGPYQVDEVVPVDWSNPKSVEAWLDSTYQGSPKISNSEILERIRSEMELPLFEYVDNNLITGNNGWNFSGI